jgi:uncharacterized membrane protein
MACSDSHGSPSDIGGDSIHPMLVAVPIAFLVAALATDIALWRNGDHSLALASVWVLAAAMMIGTLAAIVGLIEFGRSSRSLAVRRLGSFSGKRGGNTDRVPEPPPSAWWQS